MKCLYVFLPFSIFAMNALGADPGAESVIPPAQCMSRCEPGRDYCEPTEFNDFSDFDATISEIRLDCQANPRHLYAVEGMCADGRRLLNTGTGFTSEIRLYTQGGEFEGLIFQTDVSSRPCMGQFYWPRYLQCEAPEVVSNLCGMLIQVGTPAFINRWEE